MVFRPQMAAQNAVQFTKIKCSNSFIILYKELPITIQGNYVTIIDNQGSAPILFDLKMVPSTVEHFTGNKNTIKSTNSSAVNAGIIIFLSLPNGTNGSSINIIHTPTMEVVTDQIHSH